jgi:GH24 family phage-related lysozyme (muramidase)
MPQIPRPIPEAAVALIKRFEGYSATPYRCPAGFITIGYGHKALENECFPAEGISAEAAVRLLLQDMNHSGAAVCRLITVPLTDNQFSALLSFTYNLGAGTLQRSTLRRKINRMEDTDVPYEFSKWVWAAGRKLPGLVKRRAAEAACYMS